MQSSDCLENICPLYSVFATEVVVTGVRHIGSYQHQSEMQSLFFSVAPTVADVKATVTCRALGVWLRTPLTGDWRWSIRAMQIGKHNFTNQRRSVPVRRLPCDQGIQKLCRRQDVHPRQEEPQFCVGPPAPFCAALAVCRAAVSRDVRWWHCRPSVGASGAQNATKWPAADQEEQCLCWLMSDEPRR